MPDFTSNHGLILLALEALAKDLQPENAEGAEIHIRRNYLANDHPARGISIVPAGEVYDDGTVGTMDVGYICDFYFVQKYDMDAQLNNDGLQAWRELIRRRLKDQRLTLTIVNASNPSEHVVRVYQPRTVSNKNFPGYLITQLPVAVWLRELPTT